MASSPTQSHDERDDKIAIDEKHHGETLASDREKTLQFDSPEEYKQALNRVFWRIIPLFSLLYLMSFLDRVNIGQARLAGLERDLRLTSTQYQTALAVFFASYVFFEVPAILLLKKVRPPLFIGVTMVLWSICSTLMALSRNAADLIAIRFLLGLFEAGLFPGLNFVLSLWMPHSALGIATSIFFAGATLSGALGGLLALGLRQMAGIGGLGGWAWTIPTFWFVPDLPDRPHQRLFKDETQRRKWLGHLSRSQGICVVHSPFSMAQVKRSLANPLTWLFAIMYLVRMLRVCLSGVQLTCFQSIAQPFYSLSLFVPSIIAGLGYTNAAANGLSAAPYVLGFITTCSVGYFSDRTRQRGIYIIVSMTVVIVGYAILLSNVGPNAKFAAVFLTVAGVSPSIAMSITWVGQQFGPIYTRAISVGLHFTFGNSAGIISSFSYPSSTAPRYFRGHGIAIAFAALAIVCAITIRTLNARENARRDALYGKPAPDGSETTLELLLDPAEQEKWHLTGKSREQILALGDSHPAYRYLL